MAKSQRASSRKNNNQRLKRNVFGPVEAARTERLSAKLMELAAQPKESKTEDVSPEAAAETEDMDKIETADDESKSTKMDVDSSAQSAKKQGGRIEKRRSKRSKSSIVFKTYQDRQNSKKRK